MRCNAVPGQIIIDCVVGIAWCLAMMQLPIGGNAWTLSIEPSLLRRSQRHGLSLGHKFVVEYTLGVKEDN